MFSLAELRKRNPILNELGWLHLGLAAVMLMLMLIDNKQVLGINRWLKPFKFDISVQFMPLHLPGFPIICLQSGHGVFQDKLRCACLSKLHLLLFKQPEV